MSSVGIVCAKENSKRLPKKNLQIVGGRPLFWRSVEPLLQSASVEDVYVCTDSKVISNYCIERGVQVIARGVNANSDEEPLIDVLRFAYKCIDRCFDYIVTIMANCPGHLVRDVDEAVRICRANDLREVRSFNASGIESGLMVFRRDVVLNAKEISSHIGMFRGTEVAEIHTAGDLRIVAAGLEGMLRGESSDNESD